MSHIRMFLCKQAMHQAQTEPRLRINLIHYRIKRAVCQSQRSITHRSQKTHMIKTFRE